MTDKEAMQMALETLEEVQMAITTSEWMNRRIEALRAALAQPKKEWVGLTDDEAIEIEDRSPDIRWAIIQAEDKLREKNA